MPSEALFGAPYFAEVADEARHRLRRAGVVPQHGDVDERGNPTPVGMADEDLEDGRARLTRDHPRHRGRTCPRIEFVHVVAHVLVQHLGAGVTGQRAERGVGRDERPAHVQHHLGCRGLVEAGLGVLAFTVAHALRSERTDHTRRAARSRVRTTHHFEGERYLDRTTVASQQRRSGVEQGLTAEQPAP